MCQSQLEINQKTCGQFGVLEPSLSKICQLHHVTPGLIRFHCRTAPNLGVAIYRIEHNWAMKD